MMVLFGDEIRKGILAGLIAGVPQVLVTQIETTVFGLPREQADIGPRFAQRLARHLGTSLSLPQQWLLGAAFHFGYAVQWGVVYTLLREGGKAPPLVGAPMLAALIYALAFSPWGAATQTGTERPPEQRQTRETLLHWTAALSFSLTLGYCYEWLRRRTTTERIEGAVSELTPSWATRA